MENTDSTMGEKISLIDSIIIAICSPKEYNKLLKLSVWKVIRYIMVLTLLVSVIQYAIPALGAIAGMGGVKSIIVNEVPRFSLENGEFYYEDKIERLDETAGVYVIVDSSVEEFSIDDIPEEVYQAVLVSKSNMIVYNSMYGMSSGIVDEQRFENMTGVVFSNETVAKWSGLIYVGLFILFGIMWCIMIVGFLGTTLLYGTVMYFLVKNISQVTYGTMFKITIFAQTAGLLVEAIVYCIGSEILIMTGNFISILVTVIILNMVAAQFPKNKEYL